jgi:hypothetical protein
MPRGETMENYVGTYLTQKYGLKSIVIEQAKALIRAVVHHQDRDQEIHLFSKVLRHLMDEDQRYKQLQMISQVERLVK